MKHPRLRDSKRLLTHEPFPLNEIPEEVIKKIGRKFVYMLCVGYKDLTGDDWGNVFAEAIGGKHLQSPVGIADATRTRTLRQRAELSSTFGTKE